MSGECRNLSVVFFVVNGTIHFLILVSIIEKTSFASGI